MLDAIASLVVVAVGVYFLVLAGVALLVPARARTFLLGFAQSARLHYLEMCLRMLVAVALIVLAPRMSLSAIFSAFGWLVLVTTAGLLLVPWRWHQAFAQKTVPRAVRYIELIGVVSLVLGSLILVAVIRGNPA